MTWLLMALLGAGLSDAKPRALLDKNVHNGLHRAEEDPTSDVAAEANRPPKAPSRPSL